MDWTAVGDYLVLLIWCVILFGIIKFLVNAVEDRFGSRASFVFSLSLGAAVILLGGVLVGIS